MTYDGPNVFRAPYGNDAAYENFQRTVIDGIPGETVAAHSSFGSGKDNVRMWGTKETVSGSWSSVEEGDFLFFYRDGSYTHAAEVIETEQNEALGRDIWPNHEEDAPWLCVIYLDEPVEIDVDSSEIHELAGYDIDYPMGFSPLNEMGVGGIRGRYGSVADLVYGGEEHSVEESGRSRAADIELDTQPDVALPNSILDGLYFPESGDTTKTDLLDQAESALNAGKNVIFTGPPGTGKTEIAQRIAQYLAESYPEVYTGWSTTTATADWSTFDTVGGYMPEVDGGDELSFRPGQVLRCFKRQEEQRNDVLVIDEINRSDIDKSFGQLFTMLSGQSIQLPFTRDGKSVEVTPASEGGTWPLQTHQYVVPSSWRLLATMNSYDKTSLYEMSYAFMRRFAFIHVDAPTVPEKDRERRALLEKYQNVWGLETSPDTLDAAGDVWYVTNSSVDHRKVGPAIVKDLLSHVSNSSANLDQAITRAVASYVFPQLEGVRGREQIASEIAAIPSIETHRLRQFADDMLRVDLDE
ncbi:AAA family ATPase [Halobacterium litoreum]|uniref:AAA family ATPase n=1 Tax=Halobacterium litoreum TaxID=2039234 RepID=A0ABD5NJ03_9EURY|nr:MoxR family ATPase [Halobacterium litoreum]UHH12168.1 MoxR family ATPase [Halobacterium litoreum]